MPDQAISDRVMAYLEGRGFDAENIVKLRLSSATPRRGDPVREHDCVVIPYVQRGQVVGRKLRDLDATDKREQWFWAKGSKTVLWNRDVIADEGLKDYPLVITEGEWDAFTAIECGFPRTISVPAGASDKPDTAEEEGRESTRHAYVTEAIDDIRKCASVILATDNDSAGFNLREDLAARIGKARCKVVEYPEGCKDLNDVLQKHGQAKVRECINTAKFYPINGIYSLLDMPEEPPLEVFKLSGLGPDFQERIGLCRGQVSFWTGFANKGKTSLVWNVLHGAVREWGWRVGGAFFEDTIRRTFEPAMMRILYGRNGYPDRDGVYPDNPFSDVELTKGKAWMNEWFKFIVPDEDTQPTLEWWLDMAEVCVERHGCQLLVLDPWTELDLEFDARKTSDTNVIGKYLTLATMFAKRTNTHVAIIAHPKMPGATQREIPDGYSISGSAHFNNKCHLGVSVHSTDELPNISDILVWKVKVKPEMGQTGKFSLRFDPESRRYTFCSRTERKLMENGAGDGVVDFKKKRRARVDVDG